MNAPFFAPHRLWLTLAAAAAGLFLLAPPLAQQIEAYLQAQARPLRAQKETLERQLRQGQDDAQAARSLASEMKGEALSPYLAPADRAAMTAKLEPLSLRYRVSGLLYTLAPEEPWAGDPAFPGIEGLGQSRLTLEGEAVMDTDVLDYLKDLQTLGGRMDVKRLSLKRREDGRLRFEAELLWIAPASQETAQVQR